MKGEAVSRVASAGPIRATAGSEDILLSGRESAEGFPLCRAGADAVSRPDSPSEPTSQSAP